MKQSVKLILLAVLFCAYCTKAQEENATDPGIDEAVTYVPGGANLLDTKRAGRMNGGTTVSIGDYPYVVTVIVTTGANSVFNYVGVIISDTQVLTSAHTVDPNRFSGGIKSVLIRAGSNYQESEGFTFDVSKRVIHNLYNINTYENDVAILTINGSFTGKANVQKIEVQTNEISFSTTNTVSCFVLGWGTNSYYATNVNLMRANYNLASDAKCAPSGGSLPSSLQCAESVSGSVCYKDYGASLVCNDRVYGIFPYGHLCSGIADKFAKLPAASVQAFLSPLIVVAPPVVAATPWKNYMTCPCQSC